MVTSFRTIGDHSEGQFKDKGSKFLSFAAPVFDEMDCKDHRDEIRQKHFKARHHCFAYRLGNEGEIFRSSDDGEPSGTAGRPILGQIDSLSLTNLQIVVVRYFGGKLLGTSGLINAYKASAGDALANARIVTEKIQAFYQIKFNYSIMGPMMETLNHPDIKTISKQLDTEPLIWIGIPVNRQEELLDQIIAGSLSLHREQIKGQRQFDDIVIIPDSSQG